MVIKTPLTILFKAFNKRPVMCLQIRFYIVTFFLLLAQNAHAADGAIFSDVERLEIGNIVKQYLLENPEIVEEVIELAAERENDRFKEQDELKLVSLANEIFNSDSSPVGGNEDGDVTIVEFFDYQCGFCKRASYDLHSVTANDANVKVVFKEFPILGEASVLASKAALYVQKTDKASYWDFHFALMSSEKELNTETILEIAAELELDGLDIIAGIEDEDIEAEIQRNYLLADELGIDGTPAFVIHNEIFRGAIDGEEMTRYIGLARES